MVNIQVFRDVMQSLGKYSSCQSAVLFCHSTNVKMKTLKSFETSETTYRTTMRNIPEDLNLQQYLRENLKPRKISKTFNLLLFSHKLKNQQMHCISTCIVKCPYICFSFTKSSSGGPRLMAWKSWNICRGIRLYSYMRKYSAFVKFFNLWFDIRMHGEYNVKFTFIRACYDVVSVTCASCKFCAGNKQIAGMSEVITNLSGAAQLSRLKTRLSTHTRVPAFF